MEVTEHEEDHETSLSRLSGESSAQHAPPVQQDKNWAPLPQLTESPASAPERSNFLRQFVLHWSWPRVRFALVAMLLGLAFITGLAPFLLYSLSPSRMDLATQVKTFSEPYAVEPVQRQMWSLSADNPEATAYGIRGWEEYYRFTPEANSRARRLFAEAIRREPCYVAAYVGMGWTYVTDWSAFWTEDPHSLEQAVAFAQQALARNASFPPAHALLGYAYLLRKQYDEAVVEGNVLLLLALPARSVMPRWLRSSPIQGGHIGLFN